MSSGNNDSTQYPRFEPRRSSGQAFVPLTDTRRIGLQRRRSPSPYYSRYDRPTYRGDPSTTASAMSDNTVPVPPYRAAFPPRGSLPSYNRPLGSPSPEARRPLFGESGRDYAYGPMWREPPGPGSSVNLYRDRGERDVGEPRERNRFVSPPRTAMSPRADPYLPGHNASWPNPIPPSLSPPRSPDRSGRERFPRPYQPPRRYSPKRSEPLIASMDETRDRLSRPYLPPPRRYSPKRPDTLASHLDETRDRSTRPYTLPPRRHSPMRSNSLTSPVVIDEARDRLPRPYDERPRHYSPIRPDSMLSSADDWVSRRDVPVGTAARGGFNHARRDSDLDRRSFLNSRYSPPRPIEGRERGRLRSPARRAVSPPRSPRRWVRRDDSNLDGNTFSGPTGNWTHVDRRNRRSQSPSTRNVSRAPSRSSIASTHLSVSEQPPTVTPTHQPAASVDASTSGFAKLKVNGSALAQKGATSDDQTSPSTLNVIPVPPQTSVQRQPPALSSNPPEATVIKSSPAPSLRQTLSNESTTAKTPYEPGPPTALSPLLSPQARPSLTEDRKALPSPTVTKVSMTASADQPLPILSPKPRPTPTRSIPESLEFIASKPLVATSSTQLPPVSGDAMQVYEISKGSLALVEQLSPGPRPTPPAKKSTEKRLPTDDQLRSRSQHDSQTKLASKPSTTSTLAARLIPSPNEIPPLSSIKNKSDALRVVVMARLLKDHQTRASRVEPVLLANATIVPAREVHPTATPDTLIERVFSGSSWHETKDRFESGTRDSLRGWFEKRTREREEKVAALQEEYVTLQKEWMAKCHALAESQKNAVLSAAGGDHDGAGGAGGHGRTTRRTTALTDAVRSDFEMEQIMAALGVDDATDPNCLSVRNLARIPDMISVDRGKVDYVFDDTSHRVDDPVLYYAPETGIHDWTDEEKRIFADKYARFPKQFGIIADYLPNKTAGQCVAYYYLHKKRLVDFRQVISQFGPNKRKRRGMGRKGAKGGGLLADIAQHDMEVNRGGAGSPSAGPSVAPPRGSRGRKGAAAAAAAAAAAEKEKEKKTRRNAVQFEGTPTSTPTPEPEATISATRPRRGRTSGRVSSVNVGSATPVAEDEEKDSRGKEKDKDKEPPKRGRGRAKEKEKEKEKEIVTSPEGSPNPESAPAISRARSSGDEETETGQRPAKRQKRTRKIKSSAIVLDEPASPPPETKPILPDTAALGEPSSAKGKDKAWTEEDTFLFATLIAQHGASELPKIASIMGKPHAQVATFYDNHPLGFGASRWTKNFKSSTAASGSHVKTVLPPLETTFVQPIPAHGQHLPTIFIPGPPPPIPPLPGRRHSGAYQEYDPYGRMPPHPHGPPAYHSRSPQLPPPFSRMGTFSDNIGHDRRLSGSAPYGVMTGPPASPRTEKDRGYFGYSSHAMPMNVRGGPGSAPHPPSSRGYGYPGPAGQEPGGYSRGYPNATAARSPVRSPVVEKEREKEQSPPYLPAVWSP